MLGVVYELSGRDIPEVKRAVKAHIHGACAVVGHHTSGGNSGFGDFYHGIQPDCTAKSKFKT